MKFHVDFSQWSCVFDQQWFSCWVPVALSSPCPSVTAELYDAQELLLIFIKNKPNKLNKTVTPCFTADSDDRRNTECSRERERFCLFSLIHVCSGSTVVNVKNAVLHLDVHMGFWGEKMNEWEKYLHCSLVWKTSIHRYCITCVSTVTLTAGIDFFLLLLQVAFYWMLTQIQNCSDLFGHHYQRHTDVQISH